MSFLSIAFAFFLAVPAQAEYVTVPDSQVIEEITSADSSPLPTQLNLMVWNIEKGKAETRWQSDFQKVAQNQHLILLQEGVETSTVLEALQSIPFVGWLMARSFFMETDRQGTGVITGSLQQAVSSVFLRSPDREPVVNTPKVALLSTYEMEDGARLLVVNIHAINFVTDKPFQRQLDQIANFLKNWDDRVIFAGDFNTWSQSRMAYLLKITKASGLQQITFQNDPRNMVLDHIFVRGCTQVKSQIRADIDSSDHFPLTSELSCIN